MLICHVYTLYGEGSFHVFCPDLTLGCFFSYGWVLRVFVYFRYQSSVNYDFCKDFLSVCDLYSRSFDPVQLCSLFLCAQQTHSSFSSELLGSPTNCGGARLPTEMGEPVSTIHFQPIYIYSFLKHLHYARHCSKSQECISEQKRKGSESFRAHFLVGKTYTEEYT